MSIIKKPAHPHRSSPATASPSPTVSSAARQEARAKAEDICIEQTVEFPADEVPEGIIRDHVFGRIESFEPWDDESFKAVISYAVRDRGRRADAVPERRVRQQQHQARHPGGASRSSRHRCSALSKVRASAGRDLRTPPERPEAAAPFHGDQAHGAFVAGACRPGLPVRARRHGHHQGRPRPDAISAARPSKSGSGSAPQAVQKGSRETGQPFSISPNITAPHQRGDEAGQDRKRGRGRRADGRAGAHRVRSDAGAG